MRKWLIWALLCCLLLGGCVKETYRESDFLGKTSAQIVAEFGEFDCVGNHAGEDGLYRNTSCGYTIKEPRVGFLGTDPEVLFFIVFDNNGIAVRCYEGYRPGG
jgi:hypothetical protein